jgi:hypothetical protein
LTSASTRAGTGPTSPSAFSPQGHQLDRLLFDRLLQPGDLRPRRRQLGILRAARAGPDARPRLRQRAQRALAPHPADAHDRRRVDIPLLRGLALGQLARQQLLPDLILLLRAQHALASPIALGILWSGHAAPRARLTAHRDLSTPKDMA